jgi:hypothetical protein
MPHIATRNHKCRSDGDDVRVRRRGNGVFLQARRPELTVTFPVARGRINGLAHLAAKVQLAGGLVPRELVEIMLRESL